MQYILVRLAQGKRGTIKPHSHASWFLLPGATLTKAYTVQDLSDLKDTMSQINSLVAGAWFCVSFAAKLHFCLSQLSPPLQYLLFQYGAAPF